MIFVTLWTVLRDGVGDEEEEEGAGSFLEEGTPGHGVPEVGGLPLGGLGQCEHRLLGHAGRHGDVALMNRVEVLVVGRDRVGVANS